MYLSQHSITRYVQVPIYVPLKAMDLSLLNSCSGHTLSDTIATPPESVYLLALL